MVNRAPLFFLLILNIFCLSANPLQAQSDIIVERRPPQAQSRHELDAYLDILESKEPGKTLSSCNGFIQQFPNSEFLGRVYRLEMKAYQLQNDYENTVASGEKALALNPEDVDTLLTLANVIPNGTQDSKDATGLLTKAENYARTALEKIATLKATRSISLSEWSKMIAGMRASAIEALGSIAFKRGRYAESVIQFEKSANENPFTSGAQFYRLGIAYSFNGNAAQARAALKRASELGPEVVRARAEQQLAKLSKVE